MALVTLVDAQLAHGHLPLLDRAQFAVEPGERIALIGRNGSGKSSLLKVLAGLDRLDDGQMVQQQGLRRWFVAQEPAFEPGATVFEAAAVGLGEVRALRSRYETLAASGDADGGHDELDALQTRIEALDGWTWEQRVDQVLQQLGLQPDAAVQSLSGGTAKRVALAQALVAQPDLLLLDEPTNHLDLDSILWLQDLLVQRRGATVVVSHDRAFIDAIATRIVELDRGVLRSYPGRFSTYEATKADELNAEQLENARFDKMLAQEEVWIRKGVEARRTRSVGRVARLERMRELRAARRDQVGQVRLAIDAGTRSGQLVAVLDNVSFAHDAARPLVKGLTTTVLRGDRLGLVGPNGVGKTTLLKLILGELQPKSGEVRLGTNRQVAYFDQMRAALDLDATLADTISPGSEWIEIGGQRKHVMSYLGDFLFSPARASSPVRTLSGGERNRLLLARLFALPANVLVLDEPTNDLDIETLDMLEQLLGSYPGTVLLVSHDRRFIDAVCTSLLVWEGDREPGRWREVEGGIEDWLLQRARAQALAAGTARHEAASPATAAPVAPAAPAPATAAAGKPRKLSYREQRELEELPARIEALEAEQQSLQARLADPTLYTAQAAEAPRLQARYAEVERELDAALERWTELG